MLTLRQPKKRQPKKRQPKKRQRRGFTLIEMLVVLAIIVLLASMVAPKFFGAQKKANLDKTMADINTIQESLNLYKVHMQRFPSTEQGLAALVSAPGAVEEDSFGDEGDGAENVGNAGSNNSSWAGPYLKKLQKDPWGNQYQYEYPPTHGSGNDPDIWSFGPDGEDGTDDDIKSWTGTRAEGDVGDEGTVNENPPVDDNSSGNGNG